MKNTSNTDNFSRLIMTQPERNPLIIRTSCVPKGATAKIGHFEVNENNQITDGILVSIKNEKFTLEIWKNGELIDACHQNEWQTFYDDGWDENIKPQYAQIFELHVDFPHLTWLIYLPYFGHLMIHKTKIK